jgi:hypothetical protein
MKKHSPSNGQNNQLMHWWLLVQSSQEGGGATGFAIVVVCGKKRKKMSVQGRKMKRCFIAPHFYPICFGKCCPLFTYIGAPKGMNTLFQNRTFYSEEPP